MKISSLFNNEKTVLSFEVFPPKKNGALETVYNTIAELQALRPDYISVTYGAGGSAANNYTCDIASLIKNKYGIEAMAHLTCVNSAKEDVDRVIRELKENNIENILALRGDKNPDFEPKTDFTYACDLVSYVKTQGDFGISVAGYPETHFEAPSGKADIANLKNKVDCGAQSIVTQLFFNNSYFYRFRDRCEFAGIDVPISAGIMPVTNKNQIERMVSMCGASLPRKFVKMIQKYEDRPEALVDAGIAFAVDQIVDLVSNGVDGIHIYTMNNPYIAKKITESVRGLL